MLILPWASAGIFSERENIIREKNLNLMARGLTKVLVSKVELLKVSIF